jgi:thioredoxin reductase (NADPH)
MPKDDRVFDALILGGGPAGLSAAVYLGRYLRQTLVLNECKPLNRWNRPTAHNLLGFPGGIMRSQLLQWAKDHLSKYETVQHTDATVTQIERRDDLFHLTTAEGGTYRGRSLLLAPGVMHPLPEIPHIWDYAGYSVHHCPECDGIASHGKRAVVIGCGRGTTEMALNLLIWADEVSICCDNTDPSLDEECCSKLGAQNICVHRGRIVEIDGDREARKIRALILEDGTRVECDVVFSNYADVVPLELINQLPLELHKDRYVCVDHRQRTNVPRCYAAGDICAYSQTQVSVAIGQGATAGIWMHKELLPEGMRLSEHHGGLVGAAQATPKPAAK